MRSFPVISAVAPHPVSVSEVAAQVVVVTDDDGVWLRAARALVTRAATSRVAGPVVATPVIADLLVLHLDDVDRTALARIRQLVDICGGDARAVLICEQLNPRGLRRSLDAGVAGLLLSSQIDDALAPTVDAALAGQVSIPRDLGGALRRRPLSFREKEIVGLAVLGYTNSQIGARLYLAESTVKSHLSSSFTKLGVSSRSEAAALVNDPDETLGIEIARIASRLTGAQVASLV